MRPMKIGVFSRTSERRVDGQPVRFSDIRALALAAEAAGLDSFWLPDHLTWYPQDDEPVGCWEVYGILSALASATATIELGPFVTAAGFRNPALLAKMATTLDDISDGRFILGLGAGNWADEHHAFGFPFDHRAGRFEEAIGIIAPLLRDGAVDFCGTYHAAPDCLLLPRGPSPSGPPIWVGAKGERMLGIVARYADAYISIWPTEPTQIIAERERLIVACDTAERDPAAIDLVVGAHVCLPEDGPPEAGDNVISGTLDEIAQRLREFADAGVAHVILDPRPDISLRVIDGLGRVAALVR